MSAFSFSESTFRELANKQPAGLQQMQPFREDGAG